MPWVAWKQRHLWSEVPHTTCYSSGRSTYYYNCRWLDGNMTLPNFSKSKSDYFHQPGQKKYVFWLILFKNSYAYSFMSITIQWVCCIDTYRSDKISMHRDASVNRYTPTVNPPPLPQTIGSISKLVCIFCPNLVVLASMMSHVVDRLKIGQICFSS